MKQAEVVIGEMYLTRIGSQIAVVKVTEEVVSRGNRKAFRCEHHGRPLPKPRTAAALRVWKRRTPLDGSSGGA